MKRWIPKKGERVTLSGEGRDGAIREPWTGDVLSVRKTDCLPGQVYLEISGHGFTFADSCEITIHSANASSPQ